MGVMKKTKGCASIMNLQCEMASSGLLAAVLQEALFLPTLHLVDMEYRAADGMGTFSVDMASSRQRTGVGLGMAAFIVVGDDREEDKKLPQAYGYALTAVQQNALLRGDGFTTVLGVTLCVDNEEESKGWKVNVWAFAPILYQRREPAGDGEKEAMRVNAQRKVVRNPLARCLLFSGVLDDLPRAAGGVARFTRTCYGKHGGMVTERELASNVFIEKDEEGKKYKAYDYRYRDQEDKRDHSMNKDYIAGAHVVLDKDKLVIMRYPYL